MYSVFEETPNTVFLFPLAPLLHSSRNNRKQLVAEAISALLELAGEPNINF